MSGLEYEDDGKKLSMQLLRLKQGLDVRGQIAMASGFEAKAIKIGLDASLGHSLDLRTKSYITRLIKSYTCTWKAPCRFVHWYSL